MIEKLFPSIPVKYPMELGQSNADYPGHGKEVPTR